MMRSPSWAYPSWFTTNHIIYLMLTRCKQLSKRYLKEKKVLGPEGITNEMQKKMPFIGMHYLLLSYKIFDGRQRSMCCHQKHKPERTSSEYRPTA
ncbi:hypothetical protein Zmor_004522 [Zophobas morio]|uniref:Uncharacterized protein n=1 Tax=Zophobas morio TaxID=2755281 RepID=A0AA38HKW5_9CUCU|nr:hypothetical protein Zmor_004522 [Zophobas morio]